MSQNTGTLSTGVSRRKSYLTKLLLLLAILGLGALGLFSYYVWLVMTDNLGTFHNTTGLADLDNDGDLDVVLVNVRNESESVAFHQITLWFNQGGRRFTPRTFKTPPYLYLSTAVGDVDGDGDADLALLRSDSLEIYFNQGGDQAGEAGEFRRGHHSRPGDTGTPGSVALADLNNDGVLDGFVAGCCGMSFQDGSGTSVHLPSISWVWLQKQIPNGGLGRQTVFLNELDTLPIRATGLGDLDSDGRFDVFAAVRVPKTGRDGGPADRILLNDGTGSFTDSGQRLGETDSTAVALGDLEGDGDLDALVGTEGGALIWSNQGGAQGGQEGVFVLSKQTLTGEQTNAVFLDDLDGDGDLDALIAGLRQAAVWWNDGQGAFTRSSQRFRYSKRHGLAIGDFNDDGLPDIFAGNYDSTYKLWLNQGDGAFRP